MINPNTATEILADVEDEGRIDESVRFLEALYAEAPEGLVEVRYLDGRQQWFEVTDLGRAAALVARDPMNVCIGVGVRRDRSGKAEDVLGFTAVWADLDDYPDSWAGFPLEPSMVVASGRGTHSYYLIDEFITDCRLIGRHCKALQVALRGDPSAVDIARVLRVPGGINLKDGLAPTPVRLSEVHPDRRYALDELRDATTIAILSRHWQESHRHNLALSFAGYLAHRSIPVAQAVALIERLADFNADPEPRDRIRAAVDSYQRLAEGQPVKGYSGLANHLEPEDLSALDGIWGRPKPLDIDAEMARIDGLNEEHRYAAILQLVPRIAQVSLPEQLTAKDKLKRRFKFSKADFEQLLDAARTEMLHKSSTDGDGETPDPQEEERIAIERRIAIEFGSKGNLVDQAFADLRSLGLEGEERNAKLSYLSYTSRKLGSTINTELRGSTGTGKNFITDTVAVLMPPEDVVTMSRITPHYVEYLPEDALYRKILMVRERAGAEGADYSLRIITDDTNPDVNLGYVGKDEHGNNVSMERHLRGPVVLVETTTKLRGNPENESRLFVLHVDESIEHRRKVHDVIRRSKLPHKQVSEDQRQAIINRHHALQRNLDVVDVAIPYVELIKFPTKRTRSSRDLKRFLACIEASTVLHQYQRRRVLIDDHEYLVATVEDYRVAYDLLASTLRQIQSELNPQSRELLEKAQVVLERRRKEGKSGDDLVFTRREVGRELGWERYQVPRAIEPLEDGGWVIVVGKNGLAYQYRLDWEPGEDEEIELLTPEELEAEIAAHIDEIDPLYTA